MTGEWDIVLVWSDSGPDERHSHSQLLCGDSIDLYLPDGRLSGCNLFIGKG
jgi:hypothetical protein